MLWLPRNPLSFGANRSSTCFGACYRVSRQRWPLFVAAISLTSAATTLRLGVGLNVSRSAPRGIYQATSDAPARGALVAACLPGALAAFGRARSYLGQGDCPGSAQPVLKRVGAVAGDVVQVGRETVAVNDVCLFTRPIEALDSAARPVPHVTFGSYVVATDEVWLFGHSSGRSWDSRYFGPVPVGSVRSVVRPVLTLDGGWDR